MRTCIGKSYYEDSILVKCDCGQHLMEIFIYKCCSTQPQIIAGIEWHSYYNYRRHKYPDFYFENLESFRKFIYAIKHLRSSYKNISEEDQSNLFILNTYLDGNKFNGTLEISGDSLGYIEFIRYIYSKHNNKQYVWDLTLHINEIDELIIQLDAMYEKWKDRLFV